MSVAKSEVLQSKADYTDTQNYFFYYNHSSSANWYIVDNYTIYATFSSPPVSIVPSTYTSLRPEKYVFNGYSGLNYNLEYSVVIYDSGSHVFFESPWTPSNQMIYITSPVWTRDGGRFSGRVYVRRNEFNEQGERRWLVPSDMRPSVSQLHCLAPITIEQQTLPSNWFGTTTQSVPTYTTQTTMVTTVDYEGYLSTLTIPVDVRPAIATLDQLINDLWSLHYIPFVVCFALIMGLAIWLLH